MDEECCFCATVLVCGVSEVFVKVVWYVFYQHGQRSRAFGGQRCGVRRWHDVLFATFYFEGDFASRHAMSYSVHG